jgi:hypothetical protein
MEQTKLGLPKSTVEQICNCVSKHTHLKGLSYADVKDKCTCTDDGAPEGALSQQSSKQCGK